MWTGVRDPTECSMAQCANRGSPRHLMTRDPAPQGHLEPQDTAFSHFHRHLCRMQQRTLSHQNGLSLECAQNPLGHAPTQLHSDQMEVWPGSHAYVALSKRF